MGLMARCLSLATICDVNVGVDSVDVVPDAAGLHFRLFPAVVGPVIIDACLSSTVVRSKSTSRPFCAKTRKL